MVKVILLLVVSLLAVGCANLKTRDTSPVSASNLVKTNGKLALEKCGKGNVAKVTTTGFSCLDK